MHKQSYESQIELLKDVRDGKFDVAKLQQVLGIEESEAVQIIQGEGIAYIMRLCTSLNVEEVGLLNGFALLHWRPDPQQNHIVFASNVGKTDAHNILIAMLSCMTMPFLRLDGTIVRGGQVIGSWKRVEARVIAKVEGVDYPIIAADPIGILKHMMQGDKALLPAKAMMREAPGIY